jgi:hypothetical protein
MTASFDSSRPTRTSRYCRGTASVEAAIVLPFFVILFVSVYYVRNELLARQTAEIHARRCAWAYSANNCELVPAGCENDLREVWEGEALSKEIGEKLNVGDGLIKTAVMFVLDPVLEAVFGHALNATTETTFERPNLYGGGTATANGTYHLACNLQHKDIGDVASDVWNSIF